MAKAKPKIGEVYRFDEPRGHVFVQFLGIVGGFDSIWIAPKIFSDPDQGIDSIFDQHPGYPVGFVLAYCKIKGWVTLVGELPPRLGTQKQVRTPPLTINSRPTRWEILEVNEEKLVPFSGTWVEPPLSVKQRKIMRDGVWNTAYIYDQIEAGYHLEEDYQIMALTTHYFDFDDRDMVDLLSRVI